MFWLPLIVFLAHMAEELPRFPAWASRHFGYTSLPWYVYSHVLLVAIGISVGWWAAGSDSQGWAMIMGMALMFTLLLNGLFHLITTIMFREYSPGVITGMGLFVPATAYMLVRVYEEALLLPEQIGVAFIIGAVLQFLVIWSLYLPMHIDWRFRMVKSST